MKRISLWILTVLMLVALPVQVFAAGNITVTGATARRGQMVYLTVSLSDCGKANTLGISMKYDSSALRKVANESTWAKKGTLQEFDVAKNSGVWMTKSAANVNGEVCTLAFRVQGNAPIGDTEVTVTLVAKKDSKELGTYTATGTVQIVCDHSYQDWSAKDNETHVQACKYCGLEKTGAHNWEKDACTVCGLKKDQEVVKPDHSETDTETEQPDSSDANTEAEQPGDGDSGTGTEKPDSNQTGQNQTDSNRPGQNQPGVNQNGQNQTGSNRPGQNQPGVNQNGQNQQVSNKPNQSKPDLSKPNQNSTDSGETVHEHEVSTETMDNDKLVVEEEHNHVHEENQLSGKGIYFGIGALLVAAVVVIIGIWNIKRK